MSNVTLLFTLHWQQHGIAREEACVGRLQPDIARPIFPSYDLTPQYRVMEGRGYTIAQAALDWPQAEPQPTMTTMCCLRPCVFA